MGSPRQVRGLARSAVLLLSALVFAWLASGSSAGFAVDAVGYGYDSTINHYDPHARLLESRSATVAEVRDGAIARGSPLGTGDGQARRWQPAGVAAEAGLPKLTGSIAESFAGGQYSSVTFKAGQRFHRAEAWGASKPGRFLGMEGADTAAGAEQAYNIAKWGNPAQVIRSYELTEDVTMYYGRVAGGEGYQAFIPGGIDPAAILRFVSARPL